MKIIVAAKLLYTLSDVTHIVIIMDVSANSQNVKHITNIVHIVGLNIMKKTVVQDRMSKSVK